MVTKPSSGESLLPNDQRQRGDLLHVQNELVLGCPRNNQSFVRFEPKQTKTQSVSVVFRFVARNQKTFFSVCFDILDRNRNNQKKQNFVETNRKNLQKTFPIRGSSKPLICFLSLNRNKPKLSLFWLFFGLLFRETKNFVFQFVSMFQTGIETTDTNSTYGMGN
jgi:hypothetical protein